MRRIKQLQAEAYTMCKQHIDDDGHAVVRTDEWHTHFATLIIKETLQVARAGVEYGNSMEDAVYTYFELK